jgi:hypothetical protein
MMSQGFRSLGNKIKSQGFFGLTRIMLQKLLGPSYSGSTFFAIADAILRSTLPDRLIRLCPVATNQAWAMRAVPMDKTASQVLSPPCTALETGTWFGEGSTQIWGKYLKPGSRLILCDPWTKYASEQDVKKSPTYYLMDKLHHIAINSALKKVYELEETSGGEAIVVRGKSAHVMAHLKLNPSTLFTSMGHITIAM